MGVGKTQSNLKKNDRMRDNESGWVKRGENLKDLSQTGLVDAYLIVVPWWMLMLLRELRAHDVGQSPNFEKVGDDEH